jgi:hypothetical protein
LAEPSGVASSTGAETDRPEEAEYTSQNSFLIRASQQSRKPGVSSRAEINTFGTASLGQILGTFEKRC